MQQVHQFYSANHAMAPSGPWSLASLCGTSKWKLLTHNQLESHDKKKKNENITVEKAEKVT